MGVWAGGLQRGHRRRPRMACSLAVSLPLIWGPHSPRVQGGCPGLPLALPGFPWSPNFTHRDQPGRWSRLWLWGGGGAPWPSGLLRSGNHNPYPVVTTQGKLRLGGHQGATPRGVCGVHSRCALCSRAHPLGGLGGSSSRPQSGQVLLPEPMGCPQWPQSPFLGPVPGGAGVPKAKTCQAAGQGAVSQGGAPPSPQGHRTQGHPGMLTSGQEEKRDEGWAPPWE